MGDEPLVESLPSEVDVVVVGAGPAGASAAYLLAKQGLQVVCLEAGKSTRHKPCGDGIGPRSVLALRELGLGEWLEKGSFYKTENMRVVSYSGKWIVSKPRDQFEVLHGYVVPRDKFDARLVEYARSAGARVITQARALPPRNTRSRVRRVQITITGKTYLINTKLVIVADGSAGAFSRAWASGPERAQAVAFRGYLSGLADLDNTATILFSEHLPKGYGWIFPLAPDSANVGVGSLGMTGHGQRLREEYSRFVADTRFPVALASGSPMGSPRGAVMRMDFGHALLTSPGVAFIGDSAGLVSPINGEGISHAIESALTLSQCLAANWSSDNAIDQGLHFYERRMRSRYSSYFKWGSLLGKLLSDKNRMDKLIAVAAHDDYLTDLIVGILANTYHPKTLLQPRAWAPKRLARLLLPSGG